ncbi:MAG: DEAD/DEAH box helicase [Jiangellaceae bacterium]
MRARSYQTELINGAVSTWAKGHRRVAGVMATGGGKTIVFSHLAKMCIDAGSPVLVIAHRTELISQAAEKLRMVAPSAVIGTLDGRTKEWRAGIVVASVQTAATARTLPYLKARRWGLIIVDETHHVVAGSYLKVLKELRAFEPDGPLVLGVTATLDRGDNRALGEVFEAVIEPRIGLVDLIRHPDGPFLVPPRGIRVRIAGLDLARVKRTAGDFNASELGAAMTAAMAPQKIVDAWQTHAKGRPTVAFAPTVEFSIELAAAFRDAGYVALHLDGKTPADERAAGLARFRAGEVEILCNVGLFTEGTDLPSIACVILGRPTSSTGLYQQMVGRGLRLHPGKRDCIILDVSGVTGRHRLATLASLDGADRPEDMPDDLLMYEEEADELPVDRDEPDTDGGEVAEYVDGDLEHEMIDLFGKSHSAWLRTDGGVWFLPTPHGWVYLHPREGDRYDLAYFAVNGTGGVIQAGMEIGYAMAAGDEYVASVPLWQLDRSAEWRKRKINATTTRGDHYDRKARAAATTALDKLLGTC